MNNALASNIQACLELASIVQTTLGPCGMDKLLVDANNGVKTTNDGASLVKFLHLEHPAAILMSQVSKSQDDATGDGTTSVILLTAELLRQAQVLISSRGIHPARIVHCYRKAQLYASKMIQQLSLPLEDDHLFAIAQTTIGSKIISSYSELFCTMAVQASHKLGPNQKAFIFKRIGSSMAQSKILDGILVSTRVLPITSPTRIENAKILLCRLDTLASSRGKIYNTQLNTNLNELEIEQVEQVCKQIIKLGVTVVFNCGYTIHPHAEQFLNSQNVLCIGHVNDIEMISTVTGAQISTRLDETTRFGYAKLVEHIVIADEPSIMISGCKTSGWCSILLRAPTSSMLEECQVGIHDALCALNQVLKCNRIIGGGGCMHVEIAEQMRSGAKQCSGVQQLIIESFANALETIPTILAKNGGFNASKIIAQLRNLHSTKGNEWMGVDMTTGSVNNMITTRVIEPTSIMLNALKSAVDATEMILRIDQNVFLKPGKTLEELGIM